MPNQQESHVKELKLTPQQTRMALQKASQNAKSWTVWKDTREPQQRIGNLQPK